MNKQIQEIADEIGGRVRKDYSGRCMYGKTCMGIVCDDTAVCIETARCHGIKGARTDNMGMQYIVYWPHIHDTPDEPDELTKIDN